MSVGIYEAVFYSSWKVELRIDDAKYLRARESGSKADQDSIILQFKEKCKQIHGRTPEKRIYWEDSSFDIKRVRDAPPTQAGRPRRMTAPPQEPICPCEDSCVMCDIGDHWKCGNCPRTR